MLRNDIRRWLVAGNDRSNATARRLGEIATVGLIWATEGTPSRRRGRATASSEASIYKAMRNASRKKEESRWTIGGSFHANGHCKWREVGSRVCCIQNWVANKRRDGVRHNQRTHARTHKGLVLSERAVIQRTEVSCRPQVHSDSMAGVRSGLRADAHTHVWLSRSREPVRS